MRNDPTQSKRNSMSVLPGYRPLSDAVPTIKEYATCKNCNKIFLLKDLENAPLNDALICERTGKYHVYTGRLSKSSNNETTIGFLGGNATPVEFGDLTGMWKVDPSYSLIIQTMEEFGWTVDKGVTEVYQDMITERITFTVEGTKGVRMFVNWLKDTINELLRMRRTEYTEWSILNPMYLPQPMLSQPQKYYIAPEVKYRNHVLTLKLSYPRGVDKYCIGLVFNTFALDFFHYVDILTSGEYDDQMPDQDEDQEKQEEAE